MKKLKNNHKLVGIYIRRSKAKEIVAKFQGTPEYGDMLLESMLPKIEKRRGEQR